jgi:putative MATE family efflux protein
MRNELNIPAQRQSTSVKDRDYTKGSIVRSLLALSWPMIVGNSVNMIGPTIDMIWVGRLGSADIAAVGVAGMVVMLVQSGLMGLFAGLRAMIARFIGAGEEHEANYAAQQAMVIGVVSAIILAVIGIFFAEDILNLVGVAPDVLAIGASYIRIQFVGMIAISFRMMTDSVMQASGDAMTPMKIAVIFRGLHIVLSPVLIFGLWIFPRMGVNGTALTNVFSQSLGTGIALWFLLTGRSRLHLTFKSIRIDFPMIWRIVKIGIPASIMSIQQNLGQLILMVFVSPFGTLAVAAHSLYQRVEMILAMPAWGLGMAAGVLTGQNLGARQTDRAVKSGWLACGMVEIFAFFCSIVLLLWAEFAVRIFSSDPELIPIAATFLRIGVVSFIIMGMTGVFQQCITGAGDTFLPMLVSIIAIWVIQIPLAWYIPNHSGIGVYGIRWAIVASAVLSAIAYSIYFRWGKWKYKEI